MWGGRSRQAFERRLPCVSHLATVNLLGLPCGVSHGETSIAAKQAFKHSNPRLNRPLRTFNDSKLAWAGRLVTAICDTKPPSNHSEFRRVTGLLSLLTLLCNPFRSCCISVQPNLDSNPHLRACLSPSICSCLCFTRCLTCSSHQGCGL